MEKILKILDSPGKSLLCVGPLSSNIVAVAAELSEQKKIPLVLIASRRQVDAAFNALCDRMVAAAERALTWTNPNFTP